MRRHEKYRNNLIEIIEKYSRRKYVEDNIRDGRNINEAYGEIICSIAGGISISSKGLFTCDVF